MNEVPPRRSDLSLPLPFDDLRNDGPLDLPLPPEDWHLGLQEDGTFSPILYLERRAEQWSGRVEDDDAPFLQTSHVEATRARLDLRAEFEARGESYSETDEDGNLVVRQPDPAFPHHFIPIPEATGLWRVTTRDGSRIIIDFRRQRCVHLPGPELWIDDQDGLWQSLGWGPFPTSHHAGPPDVSDHEPLARTVIVGQAFAIGSATADRRNTAIVTSIQRLGDDASALAPDELAVIDPVPDDNEPRGDGSHAG